MKKTRVGSLVGPVSGDALRVPATPMLAPTRSDEMKGATDVADGKPLESLVHE
jgi:hypothetical protein